MLFRVIRIIHISWKQDRAKTISQSLARDFRRLLEAKNETLVPGDWFLAKVHSHVVNHSSPIFIHSHIRVFVLLQTSNAKIDFAQNHRER